MKNLKIKLFALLLIAVALTASSVTFSIDKPKTVSSETSLVTPHFTFSAETGWLKELERPVCGTCSCVFVENEGSCRQLKCLIHWNAACAPNTCAPFPLNNSACVSWPSPTCGPGSVDVYCTSCTSGTSLVGLQVGGTTSGTLNNTCCGKTVTVNLTTDVNGCWVVAVSY